MQSTIAQTNQGLASPGVSSAGQRTLPARFPSLDGWRALSILMVLGEHSLYTFDIPPHASHTFDTIFDGNLGVRALLPKFYRPLNWRIVRQIGVFSYSVYIWQMLFCSDPGIYGLPNNWFMSFHGWWWSVLVVAACSYYFLEKPLMALRSRFRPSSAHGR